MGCASSTSNGAVETTKAQGDGIKPAGGHEESRSHGGLASSSVSSGLCWYTGIVDVVQYLLILSPLRRLHSIFLHGSVLNYSIYIIQFYDFILMITYWSWIFFVYLLGSFQSQDVLHTSSVNPSFHRREQCTAATDHVSSHSIESATHAKGPASQAAYGATLRTAGGKRPSRCGCRQNFTCRYHGNVKGLEFRLHDSHQTYISVVTALGDKLSSIRNFEMTFHPSSWPREEYNYDFEMEKNLLGKDTWAKSHIPWIYPGDNISGETFFWCWKSFPTIRLTCCLYTAEACLSLKFVNVYLNSNRWFVHRCTPVESICFYSGDTPVIVINLITCPCRS